MLPDKNKSAIGILFEVMSFDISLSAAQVAQAVQKDAKTPYNQRLTQIYSFIFIYDFDVSFSTTKKRKIDSISHFVTEF